jgi:hypothetical protein
VHTLCTHFPEFVHIFARTCFCRNYVPILKESGQILQNPKNAKNNSVATVMKLLGGIWGPKTRNFGVHKIVCTHLCTRNTQLAKNRLFRDERLVSVTVFKSPKVPFLLEKNEISS